jgi:lysophospholipase L1-like esterase
VTRENAGRALKTITAASLVVIGLSLSASAAQPSPSPACDTPLDLIRLAKPLTHVAQKMAAGEPITIVAIGSSSTAGAGASSPAASYPSRLQAELEHMLPHEPITVINRGVNGEEVADMLKRFDQAVIASKPDLVLWQLGTNSVIREHAFTDHSAMIRAGLKKIRATGADIVLIDPQFAPKVIAKAQEAEHMVELLSVTAKQENVDLFRRYDVMKRWRDVDHIAFETFVSPDGLHMNDWSYACMAKGLGRAIAEATRRPVVSATAAHHLAP